MMQKLSVYTVTQMIAAEREAERLGQSPAILMERAGQAVANFVLQQLSAEQRRLIVILVGGGNNGGDGLVAAHYLAQADCRVVVYLWRPRADDERNWQRLLTHRLPIVHQTDDRDFLELRSWLSSADLVIDALLGTGAIPPVRGTLAQLLGVAREVRPANQRWLAVDCPSGINCDTGDVDVVTPSADFTITFGGPKRGHFCFPAVNNIGQLYVADIGLPPSVYQNQTTTLAHAATMSPLLPARPRDGHKGTFGKVLVIGGSADYLGAPILSARAALRMGSGVVAVAAPLSVRLAMSSQLPSATYPRLNDLDYLSANSALKLGEKLGYYDAVLMGPGLGSSADFLARFLTLAHLPALILDADALNILANQPQWWQALPFNTIITPHPGEMARLCGFEIGRIDRVELAREMAQKWGVILLFKGAFTVVAYPNGHVTLLPFAEPALAIPGSGDVLAGCLLSLLGQGLSAENATLLAAYVHGLAGRQLGQGHNFGWLATELADALPMAQRSLTTLATRVSSLIPLY